MTSVSDEDYDEISKIPWQLHPEGYAMFRFGLLLHRFIMRPEKGFVVDHIDGDRLNNTRTNLRVVSKRLNALNRPGVRGVHYRPEATAWRAQGMQFGKKIHLGHFKAYEDAVAARQAWEIAQWSEERISK